MSVSRQNLLYEYLSENTCKGRTAKIDAILDYYAAVDDEVETVSYTHLTLPTT